MNAELKTKINNLLGKQRMADEEFRRSTKDIKASHSEECRRLKAEISQQHSNFEDKIEKLNKEHEAALREQHEQHRSAKGEVDALQKKLAEQRALSLRASSAMKNGILRNEKVPCKAIAHGNRPKGAGANDDARPGYNPGR